MYPEDFYFTEDHEWVDEDGNTGITHYAQGQLGDIVFIELPVEGEEYEAGEEYATIESVKAVSEVYCPVSGEVLEVNDEIANAPELINEQPHGDGWIARLKIKDEDELSTLMGAVDYEDYIEGL